MLTEKIRIDVMTGLSIEFSQLLLIYRFKNPGVCTFYVFPWINGRLKIAKSLYLSCEMFNWIE